jgi:hypothetical protein
MDINDLQEGEEVDVELVDSYGGSGWWTVEYGDEDWHYLFSQAARSGWAMNVYTERASFEIDIPEDDYEELLMRGTRGSKAEMTVTGGNRTREGARDRYLKLREESAVDTTGAPCLFHLSHLLKDTRDCTKENCLFAHWTEDEATKFLNSDAMLSTKSEVGHIVKLVKMLNSELVRRRKSKGPKKQPAKPQLEEKEEFKEEALVSGSPPLHMEVLPAVVTVWVDNKHNGTGVVVRDTLLTAHHVVAKSKSPPVVRYNNVDTVMVPSDEKEPHGGQRLQSAEGKFTDIVAYKLLPNSPLAQALHGRQPKLSLPSGDRVSCIWFKDPNKPPVLTQGPIKSTLHDFNEPIFTGTKPATVVEALYSSEKGTSGAPIVQGKNVVGVHIGSYTAQDTPAVFVPITEYMLHQLDALRPKNS